MKTVRQKPSDVYLTRLRDHRSIIAKAMDAMQSELPRAASYPRLQSRMAFDLDLAQSHLEQLDALIDKYELPSSYPHETVSSVLTTVSSLLHSRVADDILSNALAAAGYKAHQTASYDALIALARHLGHEDDVKTLSNLRSEECQSAQWLEENMPKIVERYLGYCA